ncbi:hypothetical protein JR316_0009328 [Psilocybe cubensis]|uniref:Uncharacterized protein n=1 Tax=Psilocybe cubensis TaxID=181762 RepID=A0ACB8GT75_PSICU|nr:hypothetical protein JR316_0009328 [Psilocybe cubensis]KAH9478866.1 hypothetical protein JR316_0009328 [Psilocybe cubensis]
MGFKKVPDRGSDEEFPNVREASWSSGAKKRKRGRPRIHKLPAESSSTNLPQTTTYSFQNHEHNILEEEIPHYPGDLTDQQVLDNLRQLDDDRTGGKSQNDYLREWLPKREVYLGTMIGGEAPDPDLNGQCQQCQGMSGVWRCCQCFGSRILCSECLRRNHQFTPFHRVEKWTGLYFRPGALWEVGVKLYLGHNGKRCPYPTDPSHLGWDGGNNSSGSHGHGGNNSPVFEDEHGLDLDPLPASNDQESFTAQLLADPEVPHLVELDDGDDEDDDLFEEVDTTYLDQPRPKAADNNGIPFKAIVHTSGVHYLPVRTCTCRSVRLPSIDLQYLEMGLFAASFENVQTVFTVEVLEDFRMDNLECKTSAYQYYQKLRRLTSPAFPKKVLNRYRELRRLSREYRDLVLRRQYGEGHTREAVVPYYRHCHDSSPERMGINVSDPIDGGSDSPSQEVGMSTDPSLGHGGLDGPPVPQMTRTEDHPEVEDRRGKLALFCPACPQPGINLPDTWIDDADRQVLVILQGYVADGNFKADHLNQKNEGDDVWLSVGEGYMTAPGPYKEHIKEAISLAPRYKREQTCHNYHAQKAENRVSPGKRVRGIGAHACARHGCFCPSSVVDFDKGEKQMHMDWSLTQARETTNTQGITKHLEIYDINCQYCVNLARRLSESTKMHWPPSVKMIFAIGLFHVHGHKTECLYNYASTYVPGVGIIDGEILEPLWSVLNDTSRSTRSATTAHRAEVLDDHMGDSNWKKTINMAATIAAKFKRAREQSGITDRFYRGITDQQDSGLINTWEDEISKAEADREQGVADAVGKVMASKVKTAAGRQEIELHLSNMELTSNGATGKAAWISSGLKLEQAQLELRDHVRKLGKHPSTAQKLDLVNKRRSMRTRVEAFCRSAMTFMGEDVLEDIQGDIAPILDYEVSDNDDPDLGNVNITRADPERQPLPFPSAVKQDFFDGLDAGTNLILKGLRKLELQIRHGHAEDCLEAVRSALIQLSWQYKYQVRTADSVYMGTRAWDGVKLLNASWKLHRRLYNTNRQKMIYLSAGVRDEDNIRKQYPILQVHDCKHSNAVSDPNIRGGSSDRLSWIWRSRQGLDNDNQLYVNEFFRLNWLRARAQRNRWQEELALTKKEMEWTVRFYVYMAKTWRARHDFVPDRANAQKQIAMWNDLGRAADKVFRQINPEYPLTSSLNILVVSHLVEFMHLPRLFKPPVEDEHHLLTYDERRALAKVHVHICGARIRAGYRLFIANGDSVSSAILLRVLGYCYVNGFQVDIPFFISEILNQSVHAVLNRTPHHRAVLFESLNQSWSAWEDDEILNQTKSWGYWWRDGFAEGDEWQVAFVTVESQAREFWNKVVLPEYQQEVLRLNNQRKEAKEGASSSTSGPPRNQENNPKGKGKAAERTSVPTSGKHGSALTGKHGSAFSPPTGKPNPPTRVANTRDETSPIAISDHRPPYCPRCGQPILTGVMRELAHLRRNVADKMKNAHKAVTTSSAALGRYSVLEKMWIDSKELPFSNGKGLSAKYKFQHPVHPSPDSWGAITAQARSFEVSKLKVASFYINDIFYSFIAVKELPFHPLWYHSPPSNTANIHLPTDTLPTPGSVSPPSNAHTSNAFLFNARSRPVFPGEEDDIDSTSDTTESSTPATFLEHLAQDFEEEADEESSAGDTTEESDASGNSEELSEDVSETPWDEES